MKVVFAVVFSRLGIRRVGETETCSENSEVGVGWWCSLKCQEALPEVIKAVK